MKIKLLTYLAISLILIGCSPSSPTNIASPSPILTQTPVVFGATNVSHVSAGRAKNSHPNIIVIFTDDQPVSTLQNMPIMARTLLAKGVIFSNAFATTPLCCPSRSSMLTGEYVHNTGVYTNKAPNGGATVFDDTSTIGTWMKTAGYQTAYFGKYLNEYELLKPYGKVPPGWDEWSAFIHKTADYLYYFNFQMSENGTIVDYPKKKYNYSTDVVTQKAVNFINEQKEAPFFMFVGYYNPHSPYIAAPRHKDTFRSNSGWNYEPYRPPNQNEQDISDKPRYLRELRQYSLDDLDITHRQILRSLQSVDEGVGSILNTLDQTGLSDNTIIFYMTDNGLTMGEHRFGFDKNCPYEECLKIPFVVYSPALFSNRTDTNLVANIDLAPTIADLAGISLPDTVNGQSLKPLLNDPDYKWRSELLLEHWPTADNTEEGIGSIIPEFASIRTKVWKYTEYSTGENELYDLIGDPYELQNLSSDASKLEIISELALKLQILKQQ
jgi:N-acetylglucosamine-6-sulfatase